MVTPLNISSAVELSELQCDLQPFLQETETIILQRLKHLQLDILPEDAVDKWLTLYSGLSYSPVRTTYEMLIGRKDISSETALSSSDQEWILRLAMVASGSRQPTCDIAA